MSGTEPAVAVAGAASAAADDVLGIKPLSSAAATQINSRRAGKVWLHYKGDQPSKNLAEISYTVKTAAPWHAEQMGCGRLH